MKGQGLGGGRLGITCEESRGKADSGAEILNPCGRGARQNGQAGGLIVLILSILILGGTAWAADPGHLASSISAGTFEAGNYTLPDTLEIIRGLNVTNGLLYVGSSGNVGVGTTGNLGSVGSWQKGRGI